MSTGQPILANQAWRIIDELALRLGLAIEGRRTVLGTPPGCTVAVAGSLRRDRPRVGDIELLAPMPAEGQPDHLYELLAGRFYDPNPKAKAPAEMAQGALFGAAPAAGVATRPREAREGDRIGTPVKGLRPHFRYTQLMLECKHPPQPVGIDLFRYDAGPMGNRGWIELIRTGPGEFGKAMLGRWIDVRGPSEFPASRDGYPLSAVGLPLPAPSEAEVWAMLQTKPVPIHARETFRFPRMGA